MKNVPEQYKIFYESKQGEHSYGAPQKIVTLMPEHMPRSGTVLDIGAGDGRHALFLSEKGFQVTALDTSVEGLEKLKDLAHNKGVEVETTIADVGAWSFSDVYDGVVATMIFQHVKHEEALRLLTEMKTHVHPGGVVAISLFTKNGDRFLMDETEDPGCFYPPDGWLKDFFQDWNVLLYEETEGPLINRYKADGVTPATNVVAKLLAQRPAVPKA